MPPGLTPLPVPKAAAAGPRRRRPRGSPPPPTCAPSRRPVEAGGAFPAVPSPAPGSRAVRRDGAQPRLRLGPPARRALPLLARGAGAGGGGGRRGPRGVGGCVLFGGGGAVCGSDAKGRWKRAGCASTVWIARGEATAGSEGV